MDRISREDLLAMFRTGTVQLLVARVRDYDIDPDGVEPSYGTSIRGFRSVPTTVTPR